MSPSVTRTVIDALARSAEFHAPQIETLPREQLAELQLDRLRATVRHRVASGTVAVNDGQPHQFARLDREPVQQRLRHVVDAAQLGRFPGHRLRRRTMRPPPRTTRMLRLRTTRAHPRTTPRPHQRTTRPSRVTRSNRPRKSARSSLTPPRQVSNRYQPKRTRTRQRPNRDAYLVPRLTAGGGCGVLLSRRCAAKCPPTKCLSDIARSCLSC